MKREEKVSASVRRRLLAFGLAAGVLICAAAPLRSEEGRTNSASSFAPTAAYREQQIEGWRVLVNTNLLADEELCARTLRLLGDQLYQITRVVPAGPLAQLRQIPIWVEASSAQFPCMCYHESRAWLSSHGVNPEKTGAVELANPTNFAVWTRAQPWMVLHELAHGYHQRFLGDHHEDIRRCYERAKASKSYENVLRANGRHERHYALNNAKEYFAEASEAFFGTNDFYPFVRAELSAHDPELFKLLQEVWALPPAKKPEQPAAAGGPPTAGAR